jgi:zinc/manganese transport system ATP-binding protein
MNVIDLQNIETIYEGESIPVIHNINLKVKAGEFLAIIGPNGAGKTTLLETINGILPYTAGRGFVL